MNLKTNDLFTDNQIHFINNVFERIDEIYGEINEEIQTKINEGYEPESNSLENEVENNVIFPEIRRFKEDFIDDYEFGEFFNNEKVFILNSIENFCHNGGYQIYTGKISDEIIGVFLDLLKNEIRDKIDKIFEASNT